MTSEVSLEIQPDDLAQIVDSVFEAMMNLRAEPGTVLWFASDDRVTAAVHLSGPWNGSVLIECDRAQACRYAARFLSIELPKSVDNDVRDVLGELANMIGGNLKSMLSKGMHLSMPMVVDGSDYSFRVCGAVLHERLPLSSEEGPFWVTILTMPSD
jgi:chemotaxis protein CheX